MKKHFTMNATTPTENLIIATFNGSLKGVKAAIAAGADINAVDEKRRTALFIACKYNHPRIVHYLLSCPGIDITKGWKSYYPQRLAGMISPTTDEYMYHHTPLDAAMVEGNYDIARMLLSHPDNGQYLQADKKWGRTIEDAFEFDFSPESLSFLLDAATPYPRLHQATIKKSVFLAFYMYEVAPKLAELLQRRDKGELQCARLALPDVILSLVNANDEFAMEYALKHLGVFGDEEQLLPVLENALYAAQKLKYHEIEQMLKKKLESLTA